MLSPSAATVVTSCQGPPAVSPRQTLKAVVPISLPVRQMIRLDALATVSALNSISVTAARPGCWASKRRTSASETIRRR